MNTYIIEHVFIVHVYIVHSIGLLDIFPKYRWCSQMFLNMLHLSVLQSSSPGKFYKYFPVSYLRHNSDILPTFLRHTSDIIPTYFRHSCDILPTYFRHTSDILATYLRHTSDILDERQSNVDSHIFNIITVCIENGYWNICGLEVDINIHVDVVVDIVDI